MAAPLVGAIESYVKGFDDSGTNEIYASITNGSIKLVDLTEQLGSFLTSTDTSSRARATRLLAEVLNKLEPAFLTHKEVELLSVYLCDRLQDHHSLQPHALYGILALSLCKNQPDGFAETTCRAIFSEVHTQSLPQGDRRSVFNILINLLTTRLTELQKMAGDFVYGYIQAMDAEKDPRNLVLAFSCARTVIQNFPLGVFTEDMFEVISCYFPIDFTPSASDPSGITKEDLITNLRSCLAATPKFAEHCLPLLLEKLTSDLKSAKIDSLLTLAECAEVYSPDNLQEFQSSFFNCIKKELFMSGDKELEDAGLLALRVLVKRLSGNIVEAGTKKNLDGFLEEIKTECRSHLLQPELMLMLSSGHLLQAVATASDAACCQILQFSIPLLLEAHGKKSEHSPRHNVLEVLTGLLRTTQHFTYSDETPSPVLAYKTHLLSLYSASLADPVPSIQRQGTLGYSVILALPGIMTSDDMVTVANELVEKILHQNTEPEIRLECNTTVRLLSSVCPDIVHSHVLPRLFSALNTESMETDVHATGDQSGVDNSVDSGCVLETLSTIASEPAVVEEVSQQLVSRLRFLLASPDTTTESRDTSRCLRCVANNNVGNEKSLQYLFCYTVPAIYNMAVTFSQATGDTTLQDKDVLSNMAATIRFVVTKIKDSDLQELCKEVVRLYQQEDVSYFCAENKQFLMRPLQVEVTTQHKLIALLIPTVCSGSVQLQIPQIDSLLSRLLMLMKEREITGEALQSVCKCFAGLINKYIDGDGLKQFLNDVQGHFKSVIEGGTNIDESIRALQCWSWITKALVLRNHPMASDFTDKLLECLNSTDLGEYAASCLSVILEECDDVMNKRMGANIRLMYRQRFFQENLPKLTQGFSQSQPDCKKNFLLAVSHMVHGLNKQVLLTLLPELFPHLIHSLMCEDIPLQLSTMVTLGDLTHDAPEMVAKHIDDLVPSFLQLITYLPSMKVRMAALRCLRKLTCLPIHVVTPHKNKIIRALGPALDDRKRLVRREAVAARQDWYLMETERK